jgi:hypothetical protein
MQKVENIDKTPTIANTVLAAVCWVFGHRYKVTRRITQSIAELQCPRCKKEFGINTTAQALLPMDDELRSLHRELSNCALRFAALRSGGL